MKPKVLLVDDSPDFVHIFKHMLSHHGYKVEIALNGEAALQMYGSFRPDVVTLDLGMSGMNGYSALRRILEIDRTARVIIATASPYATREECTKIGAAGLITKPFHSDELIKAIEQAREGIKVSH